VIIGEELVICMVFARILQDRLQLGCREVLPESLMWVSEGHGVYIKGRGKGDLR